MGFAKAYVDENNQHIPYVEGKPMAGTMRYCSANNQQGREVGRRDDLEALLFLAVYLFKRDLPWEHIACSQSANAFEQNQIRGKNHWQLPFAHLSERHVPFIGNFKESIKPEELCAGMPRQFAQYLRMVRPDKIEFEARPPYRKLIGIMRDVLTHLGVTFEENFYDWDEYHNPLPMYMRS